MPPPNFYCPYDQPQSWKDDMALEAGGPGGGGGDGARPLGTVVEGRGMPTVGKVGGVFFSDNAERSDDDEGMDDDDDAGDGDNSTGGGAGGGGASGTEGDGHDELGQVCVLCVCCVCVFRKGRRVSCLFL